MDFIVGILLIVIIVLILINFSSISMSDSKANTSCNKIINTNPNQTVKNNTIPSPLLSNAPSALNKKFNLNEQTYDYSKYFFM